MLTTRSLRTLAVGAALAVLLAACGSSGSSATTSNTASTGTGGSGQGTVAAALVLGGPPECPTRPYCQQGLIKTYDAHFKSFKPLDAGGPLTVAALKNGSIGIGLLFTTSGAIVGNGWVLLKDDKHLQPADNVTPVVNDTVVNAYGADLKTLVDGVSAKITTEGLTELNKQTDIDQQDPDTVAQAWLKKENLLPSTTGTAKSGPTIVVGSANFTEDETLADIYADLLSANGYPVTKKLSIGSREVYYPALKSGQIDFVPDYAGSLLTFVDPSKAATTDSATNASELAQVLKGSGVTPFASAPAEDINGFVVTKATADKYHLTELSDLSKPAS